MSLAVLLPFSASRLILFLLIETIAISVQAKKAFVIRAEARISALDNCISLGAPVEPEVCPGT